MEVEAKTNSIRNELIMKNKSNAPVRGFWDWLLGGGGGNGNKQG
jgi:hypothetical protein